MEVTNQVYTIPEKLKASATEAIRQEMVSKDAPQITWKLIYNEDRKIFKLNVKDCKKFYILKVRSEFVIFFKITKRSRELFTLKIQTPMQTIVNVLMVESIIEVLVLTIFSDELENK